MLIALFIVLYFSALRPKGLIKFALWASGCIILFFMLLSGLPYTSWGNRLDETQLVYENNVKLPENTLLISLSAGTGLAATKIIKNNPSVKLANENSNLTQKGSKLYEFIEKYKEDSLYKAYLVRLVSSAKEFDQYTTIVSDNQEEIIDNLQFIEKMDLAPEDFYCKDISNRIHSYIMLFLCIDKKDKEKIFSEPNKMKDVSNE